jgi:hypothetical protein
MTSVTDESMLYHTDADNGGTRGQFWVGEVRNWCCTRSGRGEPDAPDSARTTRMSVLARASLPAWTKALVHWREALICEIGPRADTIPRQGHPMWPGIVGGLQSSRHAPVGRRSREFRVDLSNIPFGGCAALPRCHGYRVGLHLAQLGMIHDSAPAASYQSRETRPECFT